MVQLAHQVCNMTTVSTIYFLDPNERRSVITES